MNDNRTTDHDLLLRIDERTAQLVQSVKHIKENYVHQTEFKPVKQIVYGMTAIILTAVIGGIVALIMK